MPFIFSRLVYDKPHIGFGIFQTWMWQSKPEQQKTYLTCRLTKLFLIPPYEGCWKFSSPIGGYTLTQEAKKLPEPIQDKKF